MNQIKLYNSRKNDSEIAVEFEQDNDAMEVDDDQGGEENMDLDD